MKEEGKTGHEVVKKEARDESKAGPTGRQKGHRPWHAGKAADGQLVEKFLAKLDMADKE